ncbi:NAD(P)-dependent oxidoreductase [Solimicrobium silvestre]|uniref:NADH(P)-binding n=1 Tax=Solimicrobium silvestre TaxID=2099400 RepID=A0A2S9GWC2_9BURK|nr:NAD(P)-dependent oxidoreductase [Solimicrobium silvestre]PRC92014.1 NADH(P)-binding [Solimicrobium silvestre]
MKKNQKCKKIGLPRVLIVGCGDIGMRILPLLGAHFRVFAVTSQASRCEELRAAGAIPLIANLDEPATLARLAGLASLIIYLAPPPSEGVSDTRSRHLAALLSRRCCLVYVSTSGVYGDCGGALIAETRTVKPHNLRAVRRVDAEQVWRLWARRTGSALSILRVPGIYAADRLPLERLKKGLPALLPEQDVFTNHIHADDLARLVMQALFYGSPNRVYHAVDDSCLLMGEYFDLVADRVGLPRVPRLARDELVLQVSPAMLSFMGESRRMSNLRIKGELGFRLRYPSVVDGVVGIGVV